jgi:hypothetical protein
MCVYPVEGLGGWHGWNISLLFTLSEQATLGVEQELIMSLLLCLYIDVMTKGRRAFTVWGFAGHFSQGNIFFVYPMIWTITNYLLYPFVFLPHISRNG